MRLYLSSHRIGDRGGALLALLGPGARAAVISNGFDLLPAEDRAAHRQAVYDPREQLEALGITCYDLDLRDYSGSRGTLATDLGGFDFVWAAGGNAFILRRAMARSGFDAVINDLLDRDVLAYGGFSAGAVLAGPSLRGVEIMDDPMNVPLGYDKEINWQGLGLVEYTIVPHFRSNHPESSAAEKLVNYLRARRLPYRALSDGEVVVATGARGADRSLLKRIA